MKATIPSSKSNDTQEIKKAGFESSSVKKPTAPFPTTDASIHFLRLEATQHRYTRCASVDVFVCPASSERLRDPRSCSSEVDASRRGGGRRESPGRAGLGSFKALFDGRELGFESAMV